MQLPSLQRNSLSEHLRMSRDAMRRESHRIFSPSLLWFQGGGRSIFLTGWTALPACCPSAAPDPWSIFRSGSIDLGSCLLPWACLLWIPSYFQGATHHTVRHCCHHSHCHHHSAIDSGCSSRSGRGTRPPHTPGGLWAHMSQVAVDREHSACKPLNKAFWGGP